MTSARFFAWRSGPDTFGHTPVFFAVLPDGTRDMATYSGYGNPTPPITRDAYWKTPHTIDMSQACGYPPRFPDHTRWSGGEPHARHLLVSERLYAVLRSFQLPDHRDYPVEARFPPHHHVRFGDQRATYRLVHWLDTQWLDCVDLRQTALRITVRLMRDRARYHRLYPAGSFETTAQVFEAAADFAQHLPRTPGYTPAENPFQHSALVLPESSPLHLAPFDVVWTPDERHFLVSDDLRRTLADCGFTGMDFAQATQTEYVAAPAVQTPGFREERRALMTQVRNAPRTDPNARTAAVFKALQTRAQALGAQPRGAGMPPRPHAPADARERAIRRCEHRLGVVFPPAYRELLRSGGAIHPGDPASSDAPPGREDPCYWHWVPLTELLTLDQLGDDGGWVASRPDAMRALLVACDEGGDYLGFLLRDDSTVELDGTLMRFLHETGEIVPAQVQGWSLPPGPPALQPRGRLATLVHRVFRGSSRNNK